MPANDWDVFSLRPKRSRKMSCKRLKSMVVLDLVVGEAQVSCEQIGEDEYTWLTTTHRAR